LKPRVRQRLSDGTRLERSLAMLAARRRDAILEAIAIGARDLMHAADLRLTLPKVLERIGEATGVDRVHIFEVDPARRDGHLLWHHIWSTPGVEIPDELQAADKPAMLEVGLGSWLRRLRRGRVIVGQVRDFAEPVRGVLERLGTRSVLVVPIVVEGAWWGHIGLDDCQQHRDWTSTEIDTFRTLAELIGAAVARSRHLAKLADAARIVENSPTILYRLAPRKPYPLVFVSQNVARYGYSAEQLLAAPERWIELVAADYRPSLLAGIETAIGGEVPPPTEFRLQRPDGSHAWLEGRGYALHDRAGGVVAVEGVLTDVTERKHVEERLQFANALLAAQLDCSPDGVLVVDGDARIVSVNRRFIEMWKIPDELVSPSTRGPVLAKARIDAPVLAAVTSRMKDPEAFAARVRYLYDHPDEAARDELETKDGRFIERNARTLRDDGGSYLGRIWFFRDVTGWKQAQEALRESEEKFRNIFGLVNDGIFISDPDTGTFIDVNPAGCSMFGYAREELVGRQIALLSSGVPPYTQSTVMEMMLEVESGGPQTFEWHCKAKDGRLFWSEISVRIAAFGARSVTLATLRDVTERKEIEAKMLAMARYDQLTGLANRASFLERLNLALARARRGGARFAILYLDIDHFKDVNDTLGHPVGDALLCAVADRLRECVRDTDLVARFGGDEFAVLQDEVPDLTGAERLAAKIRDALAVPYAIEANQVRTTVSIGIVPYSEGIDGADAMMMKADLALYRAKDEGRNRFRFHAADLDRRVRERVTIGEDLREAVERGEFELYFQPQVELVSGRLVGVEALIRWNHPTRGRLPPSAFIPIAETTGSIVPIGRWVIEQACRQIGAWRDQGIAGMSVAVNLSAAQFKLAPGLDRVIAESLARHRVAPDRLELELTESVLMETTQKHRQALERLRRLGVRLAIDDFGTGYSSLDYLRSFRVSHLKIDRRFVEGVTVNADDAKIVRATIGLAHELGMEVVAEGVETAAQRQFLISVGCKLAQGLCFGGPVPAGRMTELLREGALSTAASAGEPLPGLGGGR
jgi:diguanylate cyclase (GGDEF)-like protein/PAS domain S-box-containing protein